MKNSKDRTHMFVSVDAHEKLKELAKAEGRTIVGLLDVMVAERIKANKS